MAKRQPIMSYWYRRALDEVMSQLAAQEAHIKACMAMVEAFEEPPEDRHINEIAEAIHAAAVALLRYEEGAMKGYTENELRLSKRAS